MCVYLKEQGFLDWYDTGNARGDDSCATSLIVHVCVVG